MKTKLFLVFNLIFFMMSSCKEQDENSNPIESKQNGISMKVKASKF